MGVFMNTQTSQSTELFLTGGTFIFLQRGLVNFVLGFIMLVRIGKAASIAK